MKCKYTENGEVCSQVEDHGRHYFKTLNMPASMANHTFEPAEPEDAPVVEPVNTWARRNEHAKLVADNGPRVDTRRVPPYPCQGLKNCDTKVECLTAVRCLKNLPEATTQATEARPISPGELLKKISKPIVREDPGPDVDYSDSDDEAAAQKVEQPAVEPQKICPVCNGKNSQFCSACMNGLAGSTRPYCPLTSEDGQQFQGELKEAREALKDLEGTRPITVDPNWCEVHQVIMSSCAADRRKGCRMGTRPEMPPASPADKRDRVFAALQTIVLTMPIDELLERFWAAHSMRFWKMSDAQKAHGKRCSELFKGEILKRAASVQPPELPINFPRIAGIPAAPRTQGRELAEFVECAQGICESATWPTIGDIDRLRKLGKVAFPGGYKTIQSLAQAQPQPAPSCPKCGSHALYMRHIEPHIGYSAVQCPVCLPSGSFILKTPADFAQFFTALPEATNLRSVAEEIAKGFPGTDADHERWEAWIYSVFHSHRMVT